jgi:DNA invertase Pin-like site-specific DNA recombinase
MARKGEHPAKGWAADYGRVSVALVGRGQDSPETHRRVNREGALTHGLKIKPGYSFYDHGITARRDVRRPQLERALRAVVDREVEALIVPALDRLTRRGMRHIGEMLDAVEGAGGRIIFVKEGLDTGQSASRAMIAFLAENARSESEALAWRVEKWQEGCRLKGKWIGKRPYGFQVLDGRLVQHPDEAPVVRRMRDAFLEGVSLATIAKDLNDDGIPSPGAAKAADMRAQGHESKTRDGVTWSKEGVRLVLINPALVGWRAHNGQVVLGPDGEPVSFGEGIISPGDRARILAEMQRRTTMVHKSAKPSRVGGRTGGGRPGKYLLSGFARCKSCTLRLVGFGGAPSRGNHVAYRCVTFSDGTHCPERAYITARDAEEEVRRQLLTKLAAMEPDDPILKAIAERWRELTMPEGEGERAVLDARLDAVRGRILDLEEARFIRGQYVSAEDAARWDVMMARLAAQRDALLDAKEQLGPSPDFDLAILLDDYLSEEAWKALPTARRREVLKVAVDKIVIAPGRRGTVPVEERVRVILAEEEAESADHERGHIQ